MGLLTARRVLLLLALTFAGIAHYPSRPTDVRVSVPAHRAASSSTAAPSASSIANDEAPLLPGGHVVPQSTQSAPTVRAGRRIVIPRIGLDALTFEGIDDATINRGPSHWPGSAEPGELGNAVFAGHRVTHTHPFIDIDRLRVGDEVIFEWDGQRATYRVTRSFVVPPEAVWITNQTDDATFTLFACHPKFSERERYVVVGELVSGPARVRTAALTPATGDAGSEDAAAPETTDSPAAEPPNTSTTTTTTPRRCLVCIGDR